MRLDKSFNKKNKSTPCTRKQSVLKKKAIPWNKKKVYVLTEKKVYKKKSLQKKKGLYLGHNCHRRLEMRL